MYKKNVVEKEQFEEITPSTSDTLSQGTKRKKSSLGNFVIKTTEKQKEELDYFVAKFFYANNIPFNAASSKSYSEMMSALRPGYKGPDRKKLAGTLS